jgi:hypothetical protein
MTNLKTVGLLGALLIGASPLAFAQTGSTTMTPGTSTTAPPPSGSHPKMAAPQGAPSSGAENVRPGAPGPQSAMKMSEQDVKKRLQSAGYSSVTNVKPSRDGYTARAVKGGKKMTVDVDGNGKIEAMK